MIDLCSRGGQGGVEAWENRGWEEGEESVEAGVLRRQESRPCPPSNFNILLS